MPKKTKETKETEKKENIKKITSSKKKSNIKKDVKVSKVKPKKATATKKTPAKKVESKVAVVKEKKSPKVAKTSEVKTSASKKAKKSKTVVKKSEKAKSKTTTKKASPKTKATAKKTSSRKTTKSATKKTSIKDVALKVYSPEYYDLPFKYNKTVVTILAQTPTNLFIYWEISDDDRKNLKKQYGEYFFEITKPVLIIHNLTKNYSFEIDINDFANSWYVNVSDSDCEYKIELGRRPIAINYSYIPQYDIVKQGPLQPITNPYIYISSSNDLVSPNDRVLFNWSDKIYFKNVKTKEVIVRHMKDLSFINRYGEIISLYELYKKEYGDDFLKNPSSGNSSSLSLSSSFK